MSQKSNKSYHWTIHYQLINNTKSLVWCVDWWCVLCVCSHTCAAIRWVSIMSRGPEVRRCGRVRISAVTHRNLWMRRWWWIILKSWRSFSTPETLNSLKTSSWRCLMVKTLHFSIISTHFFFKERKLSAFGVLKQKTFIKTHENADSVVLLLADLDSKICVQCWNDFVSTV